MPVSSLDVIRKNIVKQFKKCKQNKNLKISNFDMYLFYMY